MDILWFFAPSTFNSVFSSFALLLSLQGRKKEHSIAFKSTRLTTLFLYEWIMIVFGKFFGETSSRLKSSEKFMSHFEQLNGFSPAWILSCFFKSPDMVNFFSHSEQLNGFSPVCILSWIFSWLVVVHDLPHIEQLNGILKVGLYPVITGSAVR